MNSGDHVHQDEQMRVTVGVILASSPDRLKVGRGYKTAWYTLSLLASKYLHNFFRKRTASVKSCNATGSTSTLLWEYICTCIYTARY